MKLRIQGNSLRLRLTRGEVARFGERGRVEEAIRFGPAPGDRLVYALEASDRPQLGLRHRPGEVAVLLPQAWAAEWVGTDRVGFEGAQPVGGGEVVALLVEKDFRCLHGDVQEIDAYPHPEAD